MKLVPRVYSIYLDPLSTRVHSKITGEISLRFVQEGNVPKSQRACNLFNAHQSYGPRLARRGFLTPPEFSAI